MAIDSLRKRASVACLGLAFLGPSVVPDGTLAQADRQTIGYGYYGILAAAGINEIGGTSQIEAFSSTGGITRERAIGGTSQLEAYSSSGGIEIVSTRKTYGGYVPPTYVKSKVRKKDESILELVEKLVDQAEQVEEPEIKQRVRKVVKRVEKVVRIENDFEHAKAIRNTLAQIHRLEKAINDRIQEDEAAINALLSIL